MNLTTISTADLHAEIGRRDQHRAQLESRRVQLLAELAALDAELGGDSAPSGSPRQMVLMTGIPRRTRAKNEISLGDALAQSMEVRAVVSPSEAAMYVQKNGYNTTSKNFNMMVSNALAKDPRFTRVSRGQYERTA